ncbi:MAG TPA: PKD domain-containing protein, partial [Bacteroidetes bacterium]|nr:PKD domain-containing protein [Bacteroidota bacterium]
MDIIPNIGIDSLTGCAPLSVQFYNFSIIDTGISAITWDFGDSTSSTTTNPIHIYQTTDTFSVSMVITDELGCTDSIFFTDTIIPTFPEIDVSTTDTLICLGNSMNIINNSTGIGLHHFWDFGDTSISTDASPQYSFSDSGEYNIKYILSDTNQCTDSITISQKVVVQAPVAYFTNSPLIDLCNGDTVIFTDSSYSNIVGWEWAFGNGDTAMQQNPTYHFDSLGTYDVRL